MSPCMNRHVLNDWHIETITRNPFHSGNKGVRMCGPMRHPGVHRLAKVNHTRRYVRPSSHDMLRKWLSINKRIEISHQRDATVLLVDFIALHEITVEPC